MTSYCLRFPDEATGLAALEAAGLLDPVSAFPITASINHALDVIGPIVRGGSWNPETGEVITAPTLLDGWHANYIGELPDGWEDYLVTPTNPARVWAGVPTVSTAGPVPESLPVTEPAPALVRARDESGQFIPDDPATPENEAWVTP